MVEPIVIAPVVPLIVAPLSILNIPGTTGGTEGEIFTPFEQALST